MPNKKTGIKKIFQKNIIQDAKQIEYKNLSKTDNQFEKGYFKKENRKQDKFLKEKKLANIANPFCRLEGGNKLAVFFESYKKLEN